MCKKGPSGPNGPSGPKKASQILLAIQTQGKGEEGKKNKSQANEELKAFYKKYP